MSGRRDRQRDVQSAAGPPQRNYQNWTVAEERIVDEPAQNPGQPEPEERPAQSRRVSWHGFPAIAYASEERPHSRWEEIVQKYPGKAVLQGDTVYALPEPLIDAICEEMKRPPVRQFFTEDEEQFERDLARTAGVGFFLKQPIAGVSLESRGERAGGTTAADESGHEANASGRRFAEMLEDEMRQVGSTQAQIDEYWERQKRTQRKVDLLKWGYAGWLVTDPEYRRTRDLFRNQWEPKVRELGGFPFFPKSFMGEPAREPKENDKEFYAAYVTFCQHWCLDGLATWELPIPIEPELLSPSFNYAPAASEAGIMAFVPWYLLRAKDISLYDVAAHKRLLDPQNHLAKWLDRKTERYGERRFVRVLALYVYLELCLKARYSDRLKDNLERLDHAFGAFFCKDPQDADCFARVAESVKKDREKLNAWLRRNNPEIRER